MSPSGGAMTTVEPSMMWSPENSSRSSSSRKHRWFDAWPGVCTAVRRNSVASMRSPSTDARGRSRRPSRASKASTSAPVRAASAGGARGVVGVGVGAQDPADAVAAAAGDGVEVAGVVGARIDDGDLVDADEVGVRARARHHARVGRQDRDGRDGEHGGRDAGRRGGLGEPERRLGRVDRPRQSRSPMLGGTVRWSLATGSRPMLDSARRPPWSRRRRRTARRSPGSPGSRIRKPPCCRPTTRGTIGGTRRRRRRRPARSAAESNRSSAMRLRIVGRIRSNSPARWRASASAGRIQQLATISRSSCTVPGRRARRRRRSGCRSGGAGRAA